MATNNTGQPTYTRIIENLVLTDTLSLEGHKYDNTLIRNVTILNVKGDGIVLRDVDNVRIENCTIHDITGSGIRMSMSGSTSNVTIVNNDIYNIGRNGINAGQRHENGVDHTNLKIIGNRVDNTGTSGSEGLLHGMYIQGSDFLIEGNQITNSTDGNAISVRTSGTIRDNVIDGTGKSGISYYADHMRGPTDTLVIENNVVMDTGNRESRNDIDLLGIPDKGNVVHKFIIRDNTLTDGSGVSIGVHKDYSPLGIKPTMTNNVVVSDAAAKAAAKALLDGGAKPAPTPTPEPTPKPTPEPTPKPTPTPEPTPGEVEVPTPGGEVVTIVVRASADVYNGGAKMKLTLDGETVGEVQTVTASHAKNQWKTYTYKVDTDDAPERLDISFINDLWGGKGKDRNLWIDYVEVNGHRIDAPESDVVKGRASDIGGATKFTDNATISFDLTDVI